LDADSQSRRGFLSGLGAAAVGITVTGLGGCHNPANQVNFYTWDTYVGRNTLSGFEKQSGIHVSMSLYSSNDELFAKLRGGNPDMTWSCPRTTSSNAWPRPIC
jgi:spermidine/putrescine transport system substrate-binding protein